MESVKITKCNKILHKKISKNVHHQKNQYYNQKFRKLLRKRYKKMNNQELNLH